MVTKDNILGLWIIAQENNLTHKDGFFYDCKGTKYVPTPLGFAPNINHNFRVLYLSVFKDVDYHRARVERLKEQVEELRQEMVHKKDRRIILSIIENHSAEDAVKRIEEYLVTKKI